MAAGAQAARRRHFQVVDERVIFSCLLHCSLSSLRSWRRRRQSSSPPPLRLPFSGAIDRPRIPSLLPRLRRCRCANRKRADRSSVARTPASPPVITFFADPFFPSACAIQTNLLCSMRLIVSVVGICSCSSASLARGSAGGLSPHLLSLLILPPFNAPWLRNAFKV